MADLLDVLHVLFEEDMQPREEEETKARARLRTMIYTQFYGRDSYTWGDEVYSEAAMAPSRASRSAATTTAAGVPLTTAPEFRHHEYIPPTPFDPAAAKPFGDVLDAPLA